MRWVDFVKRYREDHPNLSYKKALSAASEPFKKHKKTQKYSEPKLKRRNSKKKEKEEDEGCHKIEKVSVQKRLKDTIKKECGICAKRKNNVPPKTRRTKLTYGSSKRRGGKRAKPKKKPSPQ
jgi:hypothetical protein